MGHLPDRAFHLSAVFSYSSEKMVNVVEHAKDVIAKEKADSVVYVIGAMAAGKVYTSRRDHRHASTTAAVRGEWLKRTFLCGTGRGGLG